MATCNKCGAQIPDNALTCPTCGAANISNIAGADYTSQYSDSDIQENKGMAAISYILILFLVPMLAAPQSAYARFHANQGLVLFILVAVLGAVLFIIPNIPVVKDIISWVVGVCLAILMIYGIINAVTGKVRELPLIGKLKLIK